MPVISSFAWTSGLTAALLFMIFGWPLANALSAMRGVFQSFHMKVLLVAGLSAASAPFAEMPAPILQDMVSQIESGIYELPDYLDRLSERFS